METKKRHPDRTIGKEVMEKLKKCIGKEIGVEYVSYGNVEVAYGKLSAITPFKYIMVEEEEGSGQLLPFIGKGSAIRKIKLAKETVFLNPRISRDYDFRTDQDIDRLIAKSFGLELAKEFKEKREALEKARREEYEKLDNEAKANSENIITAGKELIKPELSEEWEKYAKINTQDFYSAGVMSSSINVMKALKEGKTPEEAMKTCEDGLTGFQAGCLAQIVVHFHARGEEFKRWWNKDCGVEEDVDGVANPAILTVSKRE